MASPDRPIALVTGGSRGIGAATSLRLASAGFHVAVNYFSNRTAADEVVARIKADGGSALAVQGDVRDEEQAARMIEQAAPDGRLDVLVCNAAAATFTPTPVSALSWSDFRTKVTDELASAYVLAQRALALMEKQKRGSIVFVSSTVADGPPAPGMTAHGTAKAALNTFAQFLACEAGPMGVRVNVVAPGFVRTEASAHMPKAVQKQLADRAPLGRLAEADDVARAIAMLVGDDARFVTGAVVPVDGGSTVSRM
ncbi:SDR family oxidoreductase [Streptomyces yaanensis]|uniref:SDR family oxidoreductase n=1 Tax=Streptomyces yaanensis TaxID=1142239 RepID=A0ABV7SNL8_9ACTN|nr:SDR family oxidoreductase [Streptomyces sp. CGMCC 4.7035]WNC00329.1 SDR family oxidoreductase [Streptomyces sp. CGMCC 4.7035]